ncbi:MAG: hypothetical protein R3B99_13930 [Polyangiales bacterium]|nr:hypothetical protein [Myxococcales bacterium]
MADPDAFLDELRVAFPRLRVVHKEDDAFSRLLHRVVTVVTFGAQRRFLDRYVTTIGATIYLPRGFEERDPRARYVTLRHEAVHLRQFARWGLVPTALLYLLPILPLGLAWGRARIEWEAYAETFRATAEAYGPAAAHDPRLREHVRRQFTTGAYGWMWPFASQVDRWIDEVLAELPP